MPQINRIEPILIEGQLIIDYYVTTPISNNLVRQMIPILVHMAQNHEPPITYGELAELIHHGTPRIGYQLGCINDILACLSEHLGTHIPSLAGLCVLASSFLPGLSIDQIIDGYQDMTDQEKSDAVAQLNQEAYDYDGWNDVLAYLGL